MLFPKPKKKEKQSRKRDRDTEYLRWIHGWECCVPHCGKFPVDAHHVVTKARLGADRTCLPFCHYHHIGWIHGKGQKTSQVEWGISFDDLVVEYNKKFDAGEKGPNDHLTVGNCISS
jgi:hypothetical protein